jgi:hypothetical protein
MEVEVRRRIGFDCDAGKRGWLALGEDRAVKHVEGSEQVVVPWRW